MENNNIFILNDLYQGASMGLEATGMVLDKINDRKFYQLISNLLSDYNTLLKKIRKYLKLYGINIPNKISKSVKIMAWYQIQIKTMHDYSNSKISEMLLQGLNMGIISGKKNIKNFELDKCIKKLIREFISIQEYYYTKIEKYL